MQLALLVTKKNKKKYKFYANKTTLEKL